MSYPDTERKRQITTLYQSIGINVKRIRDANNLTQEEFGYLFGISRVAVNCIEQGKQRLSVYDYAQITHHFNIEFDAFINQRFNYEATDKKTLTAKKIDRYLKELMASGLTEGQKQGVELFYTGLKSIIKSL